MTRQRDIRNSYDIRNSRGTVIATIDEKAIDTTSTSLVLHGRGASTYGRARNENQVHLLENFANTTTGSPHEPKGPMDGQLWYDITNALLMVWDETLGSPLGTGSWERVVPLNTGVGFNVVAGAGMTGGGLPGSPQEVTLNVIAGTGITVNTNNIQTNDSAIVHDNLLNFVANEHTDHSLVSLIAGTGLFGSPETLDKTIIINVGAGSGITANANDVEVDSTVVRTTGAQSISGIKTFSDPLRGKANAPAGAPSYSFDGDGNTGMYRSLANQISFSTNSVQRFRIESNGVLRSLNSNYETLVTSDNDIPNKKYVDDSVSSAEAPTTNTFIGTSGITGLDGTQTYYVTIYGILPNLGTGTGTFQSVVLRRTSGFNFPGFGTIVQSTPSTIGDWPDGNFPTECSFVANMSGDTALNCIIDTRGGGNFRTSIYMVAFQVSDN